MFIDLSWTDLNSVATKLEIYRGDAPLDRANLPATPIVTLSAGETSYRDETDVVLGKTYYYIFVNSTATDRVVSQNYQVTAVTRRGPGPQSLKQGDNSLGYFGTLQSGEFINGNELVDATNLRALATTLVIVNPFPLWHKFVRNNKILLLPEGPICSTVTWAQLYASGMVFGTDDNGNPSNATGVKQSAKVTVGKDVFRVRLIRGMTDDGVPVGNYQTAVATPNEWNDLVYPMAHSVPADQRLENLYLNGKPTPFIVGAGATGYVVVQEPAAVNGIINYRGSVSAGQDDSVSDQSGSLSFRGTVASSTSGNIFWFPVLELIEG